MKLKSQMEHSLKFQGRTLKVLIGVNDVIGFATD